MQKKKPESRETELSRSKLEESVKVFACVNILKSLSNSRDFSVDEDSRAASVESSQASARTAGI